MAQLEKFYHDEVMDSAPSSPPMDTEIVTETLSNFSEESGLLTQIPIDSILNSSDPNLNASPNLESTSRKRGAPDTTEHSISKPTKLPNIREASMDSAHDNLLNNQYSVHNKGPFIVFVQSTTGGPSKHALSMGKILHTAFPGLIKRIEKSDRAKISVECFDGKSVNKIVSPRDSLGKFNLEALIPNFQVSREGIIRNILLDISVEDVIRFSSINLKCPILDARRFIHKNEKGEKIPSTIIQIKFEGQEVPEFIVFVSYED